MQSLKAGKEANRVKRTTRLGTSELSRFDDNIWESCTLGYTILELSETWYQKTGFPTSG